jgi:hypothetical protein
MIMIRNGAQVYIMMLSINRQSGGVGVNPSRSAAAPEAPTTALLMKNNHMSSGTPADRRRPSIAPPLDTPKGDKCLLQVRIVENNVATWKRTMISY